MFKDTVAVVTGAASGIGRQTAIEFARQDARVVVADIDERRGTDVVADLKSDGHDALFVRTDLTSEADCKNLIAAADRNVRQGRRPGQQRRNGDLHALARDAGA